MSIKESIIKALQNYKGAEGMSLLQIRHHLPAGVNNSNADYNLQKLISAGFVRKGDRTQKGFTYHLTTAGENYNENEPATTQEFRAVEIDTSEVVKILSAQSEKIANSAMVKVKNDLTRLDGAISFAETKHYDFMFNGVKIDPYRIFDIYKVTHPALQHAAKKILRAGRSIKSLDQDIDEAIASLQRFKEMRNEERSL
jgi:hypothetical protein